MHKSNIHLSFYFLIVIVLGLLLTACSGQSSEDAAAQAAEGYFQALVEKDSARLANLSCGVWEAESARELSSFGAVTASLDGLACEAAEESGDFTRVNCAGVITANYGNEVLEIDLAERPVLVALEDGEWRVCGYE